MGGPGSGGTRSGTPGRAYTNRTDLQQPKLPISTGRGQPYGTAAAQTAAQQAVPMGNPPAPAPSRVSVPFNAPSQRPNEPTTAGLPIGAGAGPEANFTPPDPVSMQIRSLYSLYPNNDLLRLIEFIDQGRTY